MSQNDTKANSSSSESTISDGVHVSKQKIKQQQHSTVKKSLVSTDIIHWKAHVRLGGKTAQGFTSVRVNKSTYHIGCCAFIDLGSVEKGIGIVEAFFHVYSHNDYVVSARISWLCIPTTLSACSNQKFHHKEMLWIGDHKDTVPVESFNGLCDVYFCAPAVTVKAVTASYFCQYIYCCKEDRIFPIGSDPTIHEWRETCFLIYNKHGILSNGDIVSFTTSDFKPNYNHEKVVPTQLKSIVIEDTIGVAVPDPTVIIALANEFPAPPEPRSTPPSPQHISICEQPESQIQNSSTPPTPILTSLSPSNLSVFPELYKRIISWLLRLIKSTCIRREDISSKIPLESKLICGLFAKIDLSSGISRVGEIRAVFAEERCLDVAISSVSHRFPFSAISYDPVTEEDCLLWIYSYLNLLKSLRVIYDLPVNYLELRQAQLQELQKNFKK